MRRAVLTTVIAGLLLVPATASAAPADGGTATGGQPLTSENVIRGQGTATADATADAGSGALNVTAAATAGRPLLGLVGGRSTASAAAAVTNTFPVAEGSYRVTFTYRGATARNSAATGATATVLANSVATFTSGDEADKTPRPTVDFRAVGNGGDLVVTLRVEVPEAGSLFTAGRFTAQADSTRAGAAAEAAGSASGATVRVERA